MVMVHVKAAAEESEEQQQQFLYECRSTSSIDEMTDAILGIHALQSHIQSLALLIRQRLLADPYLAESYPDVALALKRSLSEAETYVSKEQVAHKKFLSPHALRVHIKSLEKEVKIAQSKGFLDFDLPQLLSVTNFERESDFRKATRCLSYCELHHGMQLWWAGKELVRGKNLCDYIGENEKTKIVIILKPSCSSA